MARGRDRKGLSEGEPPEWRGGLSNRLREIRRDRGLSHAELGKLCVPPTTGSQILKLEKGPRHGGVRMDIEWMYRLARALECHPSDLLPDLPPTTISRQERAVVDRYRELADPDREAVDRVLDAMARGEGVSRSDRGAGESAAARPARAGSRERTAKRGAG